MASGTHADGKYWGFEAFAGVNSVLEEPVVAQC